MNEAAAPKSTILSGRHTDLSCFACHWSIQTYDCQNIIQIYSKILKFDHMFIDYAK